MKNIDANTLSEAILIWTGHGKNTFPQTNDAFVIDHFGEDFSLDLLPQLRKLKADFYDEDAASRSHSVSEMWDESCKAFKALHPEISDEATKQLANCYAYDYK